MKRNILIMIAVMLVFSLSACSKNNLAKIGDKTVTIKDIKTQLDSAKKEILETYVYNYLIDKFYEDTPITEEEIQTRVDQIKQQYSEDNWKQYLAYHGYENESDLARAIRLDMQRRKKVALLETTITVSEADVEKTFKANPLYYQYSDVDAIFFQDKETKDKAWELIQNGASLDEAAQETGLSVSKNEKAPINYTEFEETLDKYNAGDIIKTKDDSPDHIIVKINKNYIDYNDVKDIVKQDYIAKTASIKLDQQIEAFFKSNSVEILGEKVDAVTLIKASIPGY